ncbi:MAG: Murein hydrolase activator NlpD [Alphaproteobacteria bacterium MarineAlpha2_Bin1]|nr:MAG: Murein hydrolase activator NlpD [Alphaproteobacteria bacterium MarineAlpha2_Bin1]
MLKLIYILLLITFLFSCSQRNPAPVIYKITPILNEILKEEENNKISNYNIKPKIKPYKNFYIVKKGDSLEKIAIKFNINVNDLMIINNLKNPNKIYIHQKLILSETNIKDENLEIFKTDKYNSKNNNFIWPVKGKLLNKFGKDKNGYINDGINISTKKGETIIAVERGKVIFVGRNIRGFGNLLMIRHTDGWISAYAHNSKITVKKGDFVSKGDIVANSGSSGIAKEPQLHFELRKGIKPINPLKVLPPLA